MATEQANQVHWNQRYEWSDAGEEWSAWWGTSEAQWFGSILPRIWAFVPTGTILEIAPGFGRWTTFLKDLCDHLVVVDIAENCIEACRRRFASESHLTYHVNDGQSLDMVPDGSVDFAFSFDSLVHVGAEAIEAYVTQLARKLTRDGVAFIHHSNIGVYKDYFARVEQLGRARRLLARVGLVPETGHGRSRAVTAEKFRHYCKEAGLSCVRQELVNWITLPSCLIDCFSVVAPIGSKFDQPFRLVENPHFMKEARRVTALAPYVSGSCALYGRGGEAAPVNLPGYRA
jgi:2-polyprenyl-3-methyl-5-hydroxy-6-metoxy-1,4-benzoquinol methylase